MDCDKKTNDLKNAVLRLYGVPQYTLFNFCYTETKIITQFLIEGATHQKEFNIDLFEWWTEQNYRGLFSSFLETDVDDQGEGEYREIKFINWDRARMHVPGFIIEDFLNSNFNASICQ